mgnify:CR=1 FL=1
MALKRPRIKDEGRRALAGATAMVPLDSASSWKTWKFSNRDWQIEAWRLYDIVPEHRFLANWIGDSVSQARLFVTEVGETGEETGEVADSRIARLAAVPLGTGAQRDDNLRLAGVDLAVGGECWIVGEGAAEDPENAEGSWFVVTGAAFKRQGNDVIVRRPKTRGGDELKLRDGTDVLIRCWRPHPNDVDQADSPTRAAIVPLREIELLTKREFAELDSRLTGAGFWFLPEGIDFPRGEDDPEGLAGFMAYMQRAVAASMRDQSSARAMVPLMATIPDQMIEHLDKIRPITFWSELSSEISPMKEKAIGRVASAFEIPNEILIGMATANHWTAWAISEEGIKRIKPYLAYIADALTRGFLRPALERMGVTSPERYAFSFDVGPLAARPNRLDEALRLHERFLISDEEAVKAGAFSPDQMPSKEERARMIILRAVAQSPTLLSDPGVQAILGISGLSTLPVSVRRPGIAPGEEDEETGDDIPDTLDDGPPEEEPEPGSNRSLTAALDRRAARAIEARLNDRIAEIAMTARPTPPPDPAHVFNAASKLIVLRALELAGGRLTTPAERRGRWAGVPRHELHVRVGPITPDKAVKVTEGAWDHLPEVARDLGVDAEDLGRLLRGYVFELLTRGMAHHDDLLYAALSIANRGRGLEPDPVGVPA